MDVGKENLLILEVVERPQPSLGRNTLEEPRCRLVGGDTRWSEKPDHAVRFYDGHSPLDKERIEVYVAAGQQGIISAGSRHAGCSHRTVAGRCEVMCQRIANLLKIGDHALAVGRALGQGDLAPPRCEPLDLLQLHPVPGWITDHGIEPAMDPVAFPLRPHARKHHLPI